MISLDLVDIVLGSGARSVAIVGTAKNVGKTVTMNYLISALTGCGITVGLVSSGRDGEVTDAFTGEPKPSIVPPEGAWIATAEGVLPDSAGFLEIADVSERAGVLGRTVIGRMRESQPVELVGPQSARELARIVHRLHELGARVVLVDGALDRVAAASPSVTEAVILATGAAARHDLTSVASSVASLVKLWSVEEPGDPEVLRLARRAIGEGRVAFLDREAVGVGEPRFRLRLTPFDTVLGREEEVLSQAGQAHYVVIPGAVSEKLLDEAVNRDLRKGFTVVAKDPTALFVKSYPACPVSVAYEMDLLAITVNPVAVGGYSYEPGEMVRALAREVRKIAGKRLPVFDVVSGEKDIGEVHEVAVG